MFCANYWSMIKFINDKNNFRVDQTLFDSIGGRSKHKMLLQSEINIKIEKCHFSDNSDQLELLITSKIVRSSTMTIQNSFMDSPFILKYCLKVNFQLRRVRKPLISIDVLIIIRI